MIRPSHIPMAAASLALVILTSACYTKVGFRDADLDPYRSLGYGHVDYWADAYYPLVPYLPWEAFPGHPWWYQDYHRCGHGYAGHASWDQPEQGVHRNDRGPGIPSGVGGSSGGGIGGYSPPPPAPTDSSPAAEPDKGGRTGDGSSKPERSRETSEEDGRQTTGTSEPSRPGRPR